MDNNPPRCSRWDFYAVVLIAVICLFQVLKWPLRPQLVDIYYHLQVMNGFQQAGGYVTWDFWSYAPEGRPHLYPPLFHLLLVFINKVFSDPLVVARLVETVSYPLFIFGLWAVSRRLFSSRFAFFLSVLLVSDYAMYLAGSNTIPSCLSFLLGWIAILAMEKRKMIAAVGLLTMAFYTHVFVPWLLVLGLCIYAFLEPGRRGRIMTIVGPSLVLAAPLLYHQFSHYRNLQVLRLPQGYPFFEINILVYLSFLLGFYVCMKKKGQFSCLAGLFLGFLPLGIFYKERFFSYQGLIAIILVAAAGLEALSLRLELMLGRLIKKKGARVFLSAAGISLLFLSISPGVIYQKSGWDFIALDSTFVNLLPSVKEWQRTPEVCIYHKRFTGELISLIKEHTKNDDLLFTNYHSMMALLSVFSGRSGTSGMLAEVGPQDSARTLQDARLIVWFKEPTGASSPERGQYLKTLGMEKIAETEVAEVFLNPRASARRKIPAPLLSLKATGLILLVFVSLIIWDFARVKSSTTSRG